MAEPPYHALLIGNSTYPSDPQNLQRLNGPIYDVAALREALTDPVIGLFAPSNVTVLSEGTMTEILMALERFFLYTHRENRLLLYYSGHGLINHRNQLYLAARDTRTDLLQATGVSAAAVNTLIDDASAQTTVIVLDCCHSGAFKGGDLSSSLHGEGRFILSSCRSGQLANDADASSGTSMFTSHVIEGIRGAAADLNGDGYISVSELYEYVHGRLRAEGRQIPQRSFHGGGDIALARRPPGAGGEPASGRPATPADAPTSSPEPARPPLALRERVTALRSPSVTARATVALRGWAQRVGWRGGLAAAPGLIAAVLVLIPAAWRPHGGGGLVGSGPGRASGAAFGLVLAGAAAAACGAVRSRHRVAGGAASHARGAWRAPPRALAVLIATVSAALLLSVAAFAGGPAECSAAACPAPSPPCRDDGQLAVCFASWETPTTILRSEAAQYSLAHLPPGPGDADAVPAWRLDEPPARQAPLRLVLSVRTLAPGGYSVIIEQVAMVLDRVTSVAVPLRVWDAGPPGRDSGAEPYLVAYHVGDGPGALLVAAHGGSVPWSHPQVSPGGPVTLGIELDPQTAAPVDVTFRIRIDYRVGDQSMGRSFIVPEEHELVLSDAQNWLPYHLTDSGLVPGDSSDLAGSTP